MPQGVRSWYISRRSAASSTSESDEARIFACSKPLRATRHGLAAVGNARRALGTRSDTNAGEQRWDSRKGACKKAVALAQASTRSVSCMPLLAILGVGPRLLSVRPEPPGVINPIRSKHPFLEAARGKDVRSLQTTSLSTSTRSASRNRNPDVDQTTFFNAMQRSLFCATIRSIVYRLGGFRWRWVLRIIHPHTTFHATTLSVDTEKSETQASIGSAAKSSRTSAPLAHDQPSPSCALAVSMRTESESSCRTRRHTNGTTQLN